MIPNDLIDTDFPQISPIALVEQAARLMRDNRLHALPVVENGNLKGIIACEDIVYRGIAEGEDWFLAHVEDFMTRDPNFALISDELSTIRALMRAGRHKWLPVVNKKREYYGVLKSEALHRVKTLMAGITS